MFTGIVEQTGRVTEVSPSGLNLRLRIAPERMWQDLSLGESVAVSGVCLTVVARDAHGFWVDVSPETRAATAERWQLGVEVNLERALRADSRLGGHLVSGHVDGVGELLEVRNAPEAASVLLRVPVELARYLAPKGSLAVDGVSLTVVEVGGPGGNRAWPPEVCRLWLVPHTLAVTALKHWQAGMPVNVEVDQLAKYLERLVAMRGAA